MGANAATGSWALALAASLTAISCEYCAEK